MSDNVTSNTIGVINKIKVVLVVGHKEDSQGACNCFHGVCEWEFNNRLVKRIDYLVDKQLCKTEIVYRDEYKTLPDKVNALSPDFVLCFHANAFDAKTSGAETLYYHKSVKGKKMATLFQNNVVKALDLKDRGIKARTTEQRGGYMLRYVNSPCIILEPFFIDNDIEFRKISKDWKKLAAVCRDSIYELIEKV